MPEMRGTIRYKLCISIRRFDDNGYETDDKGQEVDAVFEALAEFKEIIDAKELQ